MDENRYTLRSFRPEDGAAYAALLAASPDTGSIGATETFEIDPYQALVGVYDEGFGLVAERPGGPGLAGGACVRSGRSQWEGAVVPSALLHTVVVHPDCRRQGLASQLETQAASRFGDEGVFFAAIQRNNTGSERAAGKWANQFLKDRLAFVSMPVRSRRPSAPLVVRPARAEEMGEVADRANEFHRRFNLYTPETAESLAAWLAKTPFETPYRHYRLVADHGGRLLGGLALVETHRLRTTQVTRMPGVLRALNRIFRIIPLSGQLRELTVCRAWFAPGRRAALHHLLEMTRWEWRERVTTIMLLADVHSPLLRACSLRFRAAPMRASLAIRSAVPVSADRFLYYGS